MKLFGSKDTFGFELVWTGESTQIAADATRGRATVWLSGTCVWGRDGLEWTWVELLEHLARFWPDLLLEERDPLDLRVDPEQLRAEASKRWALASSGREEQEDEALFAYLEAHDLAAAMMGVFLPSLFVTRQGKSMRFACAGQVVFVAETIAKATLTAIGDGIAERLALVEEERARAACTAWNARERAEPDRILTLTSGLDTDQAAFLAARGIDVVANDFEAAARPSELLAVARMSASSLPNADIATLLSWVQAQAQVWTGSFDKHAEAARAKLVECAGSLPYEEGVAIARVFRARMGVKPDERVDPEGILADWKVSVSDLRLSARHLDAVCTWGPRHGPAIAVNRKGVHARFAGRRATLAHEIGHLLMDREDALPLGEVLGGSVPLRIEQRARAFAAELLIPQETTVPAMKASIDPGATISELAERFGCSREIVAWQVRNGWGGFLPHDLYSLLRSLVQDPAKF